MKGVLDLSSRNSMIFSLPNSRIEHRRRGELFKWHDSRGTHSFVLSLVIHLKRQRVRLRTVNGHE